MSVLSRIRFNLSEASTKRGLALFITGSIAVYQMLFGNGGSLDLDAISHRAEFWLGIGAQLSGIIGMFLPDEPKTVKIELPALEMQSRSEGAAPGPVAPVTFGRVHDDALYPAMDVSPQPHPRPDPAPKPFSGFNDQ